MNALGHFHRRLSGEALSDLAGIVGHWIPAAQRRQLRQSGQRRRAFTPMATFWNFLAQVLNPRQPCREAVRRIQAQRQRRRQAPVASGSSAYCQARRRLPEDLLRQTWQEIAKRLTRHTLPAMRWKGLRVAVVDGTTISMPDTAENQATWPQPSEQKRGCGFPVMKIVALFSLATGAINSVACGSLHNGEHALFVSLWNTFCAQFDLLLGDRNFGSYATFAALRLCDRHGVFRLHQSRKVDWRQGRRLGKNDRLLIWTLPRHLSWWLPSSAPESITVRIVKIIVPVAGFRTRVVFLSTTLLDPVRYPAESLAELYFRRWQVELFFAHIKTTLHMDIVRCLSPEMIRRELHMHLIAYNLIRALMFEAAAQHQTDLHRISFKGPCDALRQWAPHLAFVAAKPSLYRRLLATFLHTLAEDLVPLRPNRSEPRAVKRRPKNFHYLTKPRHLMGNLPHRNYPASHH